MMFDIFKKSASAQRTPEDWYILNQRAELSEDECLEFLAWLQEDPQNERAYEKVERTSHLMRDAAADNELKHQRSEHRENKYPIQAWAPALAASVAFLVLSTVIFLFASSDRNNFHTDVGEQKIVVLDDGSLVRLNTSTDVYVNFDEFQRRIVLNSGEAYFDVKKDPQARPFLVEIDSMVVRAVGTEFNIHHTDDATSVDVLEGVVEVLKKDSGAVPAAKLSEISEGFKVIIQPDGAVGELVSADVMKINAWTDGRLEFDSDRLALVVDEFNRYSKTKIVIADETLGNFLISGSFVIGGSEEFAHGLEDVFPIVVVRRQNELILMSAAQPLENNRPG